MPEREDHRSGRRAVPAIRNRRFGKVGPSTRAEPPGRQRKGLGQAVVKGQILLAPEAHRDAWRHLPGASARCSATKPSQAPSSYWMWLALQAWVGTPGTCTVPAKWVRVNESEPSLALVGLGRFTVCTEVKAFPSPGEHAEVIVVGVVFHHQHNDVFDLGQRVCPCSFVDQAWRRRGWVVAPQSSLRLTYLGSLQHDLDCGRDRCNRPQDPPGTTRTGLRSPGARPFPRMLNS